MYVREATKTCASLIFQLSKQCREVHTRTCIVPMTLQADQREVEAMHTQGEINLVPSERPTHHLVQQVRYT
ncbi:hypothetical protein E2C01_070298 [Portunus trituberculatus]|uniref:Uncharacterized protein n=1 Tax=Portunus trituberculatus TaxID=210409 RepID=A0A5B7I1W6_PORTR|nr:hypothetical protein [Portunus trituberculatus]